MRWIALPLLLFVSACQQSPRQSQGVAHISDKDQKAFSDYWFAGKAEITSYALEQFRYGETHHGEAVLVFVTEDFSRSRQVKLDDPSAAGSDRVNVLKLNFTKNFTTGIYPYHMMLSVFNPTGEGRINEGVKAAASVQEWCGQTFMQINLAENGYMARSFSYFESEGDQVLPMGQVMLEDELWNLIRLNPAHLPVGDIVLLPGLFDLRLHHRPLKPSVATASLENTAESHVVYQLAYETEKRKLRIQFERQFPYSIEGWEETILMANGKTALTRATKKARLSTDYWNQNTSSGSHWRDSLQLAK
jgi:hypothetical protein